MCGRILRNLTTVTHYQVHVTRLRPGWGLQGHISIESFKGCFFCILGTFALHLEDKKDTVLYC